MEEEKEKTKKEKDNSKKILDLVAWAHWNLVVFIISMIIIEIQIPEFGLPARILFATGLLLVTTSKEERKEGAALVLMAILAITVLIIITSTKSPFTEIFFVTIAAAYQMARIVAKAVIMAIE